MRACSRSGELRDAPHGGRAGYAAHMKLASLAALLLVTACASVEGLPARPIELERIALLEDARADAKGELLALARSSDARVRERTATALGRMPFPEHGADATRALLELLRDREPAVRACAAFALGVRGDPSAADTLLFVATDEHERDAEPLVRARAIEAAGKLARPELRGRTLDGLLDSDAGVRLEAAAALGRWSVKEDGALALDERLAAHLADESATEVVTAALFALERRKTNAGGNLFVRFSTSSEPEQRIASIRGLRALVGAREVAGFLQRASQDSDARVACEALIGLGQLADRVSLAHLAVAARHSSASVRRTAWEAIGVAIARRPGALDELRQVAIDVRAPLAGSSTGEASPWVRGAMLEAALSSLASADEAAVEAALRALGSSYRTLTREERMGAVRGCAQLPAQRGLTIVLDCIRDPDFAVGGVAVEMLTKFNPEDVRDALHAVLEFDDNGLRLAAVTALLEMPSRSDLEPLERCYRSSQGDGTNEIRFNALRAATKGAGRDASALLVEGCGDRSAFVRRVAREELARVAPEALAGIPPYVETPAEALFPLPGSGENPWVDIVTSKGTLRFELLPGEAPLHVHNFLTQAASERYDGTLWHRVVPDFVIQGGDYRGDGNGGGTWRGSDDSLRHEFGPRKYVRGSLGMPRNEDPDSGGSQLFVTHRATPHLDGRYTIFGELREGFDVLDAIEVGDRILDVVRVK